MPKPNAYQNPGEHFRAFLRDAQDELGTPTSNATYTTVQAVLTVFRRRLTLEQAVRFAQALPPVLCALFLQDYNLEAEAAPFSSRDELDAEVKRFRGSHNFSPDGSIACVSEVLWRHADRRSLENVLANLPAEAERFWNEGRL